MKILYIEHYAGSLRHGMEFRPYYMAKEWHRKGHEVTIVAASFSHVRTFQPVLENKKSEEYIDGIRYIWIPTPKYSENGFKRILNIMFFLWGIRDLQKIFPEETFDVIISSSTYPFDNGVARRFAKRWRALHVYEVHDLWPLSPIELKGYSRFNPLILVTQISENRAYHFADLVVSLLPAAEPYMLSHGLASGKFFYIPNGIVVDDWIGSGSKETKNIIDRVNKWSKGRPIVCYAGAIGLANALDDFIYAAKDLPQVGFVLVGSGLYISQLQEQAKDLENVMFIGQVPKATIPQILNRMDILYIGLKKQPLFRYGISPNKLMDYMMAAKPIICAIEAGNDIVGEAKCGYTIPPEDKEAIINAIKNILGLGLEMQKKMGESGKDYVIKYHSYSVLAEQFLMRMELDRNKKLNEEF